MHYRSLLKIIDDKGAIYMSNDTELRVKAAVAEQLGMNVEDINNDASFMEDLNGDKNLFNDDTDANNVPNFLDGDDDGDRVLTINEMTRQTYTVNKANGDTEPVLAEGEYVRSREVTGGILTIKTLKVADANGDGVPDHLQKSVTTDYSK